MTVHPGAWQLPRGTAWFFAALALPAAQAQEAAGSGLTITPAFSVTETVTSNRDLSSSNPQADVITQISPGIRIGSRGGRLQGSLAYSVNVLNYARASQLNSVQLQNALDSAFGLEALENHARVDVRASVSQQAISAYGTQASSTALVNANRTEVSTLSVAPSLRGKLGDFADVNAGLNWVGSRSKSTQLGDSSSYGGQMGLNGHTGLLGWGLNGSHQVSAFKLGRTTATDQLGGTLTYVPQYDLQFSLRLGRQASDVLTGSRVWYPTSGLGVNWQPTERTNLSLQGDRTYYGQSHSYAFTHRMARSVWSYTDSSSVSTPNPQAVVQPLTLYDLLYSICLSSGGDSVGCDTSVRAALAQQGLSPGTVVAGGFLNSSLTLQHSQNLAVSYAALRSTFTLSVFRTATSALGQVAAGSADLAPGAPVRQQGASLGASHQLTSTSSLTLTATQQKTLDSGAQVGNQQRTVLLAWSLNPGPRTSLSVSARHTQFASATNPYEESALVGSLALRF